MRERKSVDWMNGERKRAGGAGRLTALAVMLLAAPALAHTPHTVDFDNGADDTLTNRPPEQMSAQMEGMDMATGNHATASNVDAGHADKCAHPFDAAMQKMHRDMMAPPSGNADADFAAMMIPHHQGAIDMAKAELQRGHDPQLRDLATKIVAAQEDEIGMMRSWLASHK